MDEVVPTPGALDVVVVGGEVDQHSWSTEVLAISVIHPRGQPLEDQILKVEIDGIPYDIQITRKD